jgi:ADP-heptose:LPS heptosyltransferase
MSATLPGTKPAKRVLIYRLGSLGDTVVALPAFHLVERAFPQAERRMLTSYPPTAKAPPSSAVLENTGLIHGFFRYNYGTRDVRELLSLWWQLLRWRPDVLVYMSGQSPAAATKRNVAFFRICGITRFVGVPVNDDMRWPLREDSSPVIYDGTSPPSDEVDLEFECSRLVRNLSELGDGRLDDPASWDLRLTSAEHARAAEVLEPAASRPIIAVSIGTKMQAKDWERENWRAFLVRAAAEYPGHALALCGAPEESEASEFAANGWREVSSSPVINLCGVLTPRQSAAVFARAEIFIGHDSGPMHLAAAVQTPCVAVFSSRNIPHVWFPYGKGHRVLYHHVDCQGCNLQVCTIQKKKCILSIQVEEVLAEVIKVMPPTETHVREA